MLTATANGLSRQEVEDFHTNGFLGPYTLCSPEEMAVIRGRIEQEILTTDGPNKRNREQGRHQDKKLVYDLCSHPAIVERFVHLLGPDLVLWASYFFTKHPGGKEIPWHQDLNYWPIDPPVNVSAWLAIDECTVENSCVRILPKSHRKVLQHVKSGDGMAFSEMADTKTVDLSKAVDMVLKPGEFFIFSERTLHQSNANVSNKRRMGMAVRVTVPFVKIYHHQAPLYEGHKAIVMHGEDHLKLNTYCEPPVA